MFHSKQSVNRIFAECPIECTRQTLRHSAILLFPVAMYMYTFQSPLWARGALHVWTLSARGYPAAKRDLSYLPRSWRVLFSVSAHFVSRYFSYCLDQSVLVPVGFSPGFFFLLGALYGRRQVCNELTGTSSVFCADRISIRSSWRSWSSFLVC